MTPSRGLETLGGGAVNITPGLAPVNRHPEASPWASVGPPDDQRGEGRGRKGAQRREAVGIGRLSET